MKQGANSVDRATTSNRDVRNSEVEAGGGNTIGRQARGRFEIVPARNGAAGLPADCRLWPRGTIANWRDLMSAAVAVRSMLGVSPSAYQDACSATCRHHYTPSIAVWIKGVVTGNCTATTNGWLSRKNYYVFPRNSGGDGQVGVQRKLTRFPSTRSLHVIVFNPIK